MPEHQQQQQQQHDAFDLVIIGSGPGGYIAAVRAAQLGMKVACVEKDPTLGGTCLNVGCIPSKALLESSERFEEARHALADHGVDVDGVSLNLDKMLARKNAIVDKLTSGVQYLFNKNKIETVRGFGRLISPNEVAVDGPDGERRLKTQRVLLATGSVVSDLPGVERDGARIVSSTEALDFPEVPDHLMIIGAGVIGLELGSVWRRLGARVTVLEYLPKVLGGADDEISREARKLFSKQGIDFKLEVRVTGARLDGDVVVVSFEPRDGGEPQELRGDRLLVAVGRRPFTHGLGLDDVGVHLDDRGRVPVDHDFQTNVKGVFAIGDLIPGPMLAHKAEEEGVVCVERMTGMGSHINYDAIPDVVYTWPEVASVGRTEQALKAAGVAYRKGSFPFAPNGRAKALGATDGKVKILSDASTDRLLGCHIIGPRAGDLIAELAVAMEFGASSEDIARSSHAHPTLAEVVKEAALAVDKRALNL